MKETACTLVGIIGSAFCWAFGGWDSALAALMVCMAVDYISGSLVALVFHKSTKTESGAYNSSYGLKGLCKKGLMLLFVLVAVQIDKILGTAYARDAVSVPMRYCLSSKTLASPESPCLRQSQKLWSSCRANSKEMAHPVGCAIFCTFLSGSFLL